MFLTPFATEKVVTNLCVSTGILLMCKHLSVVPLCFLDLVGLGDAYGTTS